jgi:hypothetical protein
MPWEARLAAGDLGDMVEVRARQRRQ